MGAEWGFLPAPRHTRFPGLKRLHLRRIGTPLIIIVHPGTDAIADEAADRSARETSRDALASPTAELRADQTAGNSADERAGIFLWSLASFGSAGARRHPRRHPQCDSRNSTQANERHVSSPQMIPLQFETDRLSPFGRGRRSS